jgi:MFS family permease
LDILQLGIVWGTMSLTAMVIGLVGGTLGDRFGTRRTIGVACLLTGMFGALRGVVPSYGLLVVSFLLYGLIAPGIPPNVHKTGASFFPKRRGLSAGTISVGMALRYLSAYALARLVFRLGLAVGATCCFYMVGLVQPLA